MVFDAMAAHKSKMLSMDAFKTVIQLENASSDDAPKTAEDDESWAGRLEKLPTLKEADTILIGEALKRANGNQRLAASMLGISHQALNKRLKRSGN